MSQNLIDVGELYRRIGVKDGTRSVEFVPGVFPVVDLGDYRDQVARPKTALGCGGKWAAIEFGTVERYWFHAGQYSIVKQFRLNSIFGWIRWWMRKSTTSPTAIWNQVQLGELPINERSLVSAAPAGVVPAECAFIAYANWWPQALEIPMQQGESLEFFCENIHPNQDGFGGIWCLWTEPAAAAIEP